MSNLREPTEKNGLVMSCSMAGKFIKGRNGAFGEAFSTQLVTDERVSSVTLPKSLGDEQCLETESKCFTKRFLLPADRQRPLRAFSEWMGQFLSRSCLPPVTFHFANKGLSHQKPRRAKFWSWHDLKKHNSQSLPRAHHRHD